MSLLSFSFREQTESPTHSAGAACRPRATRWKEQTRKPRRRWPAAKKREEESALNALCFFLSLSASFPSLFFCEPVCNS